MCHKILTKKKEHKKTESTGNKIAKMYQIEGSKKMKNGRKKTDYNRI